MKYLKPSRENIANLRIGYLRNAWLLHPCLQKKTISKQTTILFVIICSVSATFYYFGIANQEHLPGLEADFQDKRPPKPAETNRLACPDDSELSQIVRKRKQQIIETCSQQTQLKKFVDWNIFESLHNHPFGGNNPPKEIWWARFIYSDRNPKTGTTPIKVYLRYLEDLRARKQDLADLYNKTSRESFMALHQLIRFNGDGRLSVLGSINSTQEARRKWESYFKFVFLRDPLERLISAWQDKFAPGKSYNSDVAQKIVKKSRLLKPNADSTNRSNPTPEEFFMYLEAKDNPISFDAHWRPQVYVAFLCEIDYDFIGFSNESMACEFEYIARKITGYHTVPKMTTTTSDPAKKQNVIDQIPKKLVNKVLKKHYALDYKLLGLQMPTL